MAVDSYENVVALSRAAHSVGVELRVLVEVNIGHNRCGVEPFQQALGLSREVLDAPNLKYEGLMGYDGHCTMGVTAAERGRCQEKQTNYSQICADISNLGGRDRHRQCGWDFYISVCGGGRRNY